MLHISVEKICFEKKKSKTNKQKQLLRIKNKLCLVKLETVNAHVPKCVKKRAGLRPASFFLSVQHTESPVQQCESPARVFLGKLVNKQTKKQTRHKKEKLHQSLLCSVFFFLLEKGQPAFYMLRMQVPTLSKKVFFVIVSLCLCHCPHKCQQERERDTSERHTTP